MCVLHDNSKNNESISLKLEHIVVYGNSSDEIDIGHCSIRGQPFDSWRGLWFFVRKKIVHQILENK